MTKFQVDDYMVLLQDSTTRNQLRVSARHQTKCSLRNTFYYQDLKQIEQEVFQNWSDLSQYMGRNGNRCRIAENRLIISYQIHNRTREDREQQCKRLSSALRQSTKVNRNLSALSKVHHAYRRVQLNSPSQKGQWNEKNNLKSVADFGLKAVSQDSREAGVIIVREMREKEWKKLETLILNCNVIGNDGARVISDMCFPSLLKMKLDQNEISQITLKKDNLPVVKHFSLSRNQLRELSQSFLDLQTIQYLYLNNNQFTTIPKLLLQMSNLSWLYIYQNHIPSIRANQVGMLLEEKGVIFGGGYYQAGEDAVYDLKN